MQNMLASNILCQVQQIVASNKHKPFNCTNCFLCEKLLFFLIKNIQSFPPPSVDMIKLFKNEYAVRIDKGLISKLLVETINNMWKKHL